MEVLASGLSAVATMFTVAMVLAGVMKLFQIHTTLTEIKDAMRAGGSFGAAQAAAAMPMASAPVYPTAPAYTAPVPSASVAASPAAPPATAPAAVSQLYSMGSGEEMLRALDAQMKLDELEARTPEVVDPPRF